VNTIAIAYTAAGGVALWCAIWWLTRTPKHGKHRTTVAPTVAAHHPLPPAVDLGPDTATWPALRHTHRDPTTGRFVPRGKL